MKKGDIITGENGEQYVIVKSLGKGGQAKVWKVQNVGTKQYYAYKFYKRNPCDIRENIETLIGKGQLRDKNGNVLNTAIFPLSIVEGEGDSFGYIMELVDLKDYTTLKKAWARPELYPSCAALCRIVKNMSSFFEALHSTHGMCYKDINEGNIFFNPVTGDVKIIDNDNIAYPGKVTISGTYGYRAPEIVLGKKPDERSDSFSFAVYIFRLLVGGYPFEGSYTREYCRKHDVCEIDVQKVIYGTDAVFIWNPYDRRNSIENSADEKWEAQARIWKRLPARIQNLFIDTFVTYLPEEKRAERPSDEAWGDAFADLKTGLLKCRACGCVTFGGSGHCFECGAAVPVRRHSIVFKVLSAGEPKRETKLYVADVLQGTEISKHLPGGDFLKILYNKPAAKVGIRNVSGLTWCVIGRDKSMTDCPPGSVFAVEEGMMIRIIPKTAQLNVLRVE